MVAEKQGERFFNPQWRPAGTKDRNAASKRPRSAQPTRVSSWGTIAAGKPARIEQLSKTAPRAATPRAPRTPSLAARLNTDTVPTCDGRLPIGHSIPGNFASLAQPGDSGLNCNKESVTDTRLAHLQKMIEHKFENQSGGHVVLPAFRIISHANSKDDQPGGRRAHPRDLAGFIANCGAHATEAEAAQLLIKARGGRSSADGKFGIRTFHDLARGVNAGPLHTADAKTCHIDTPSRARSARRTREFAASDLGCHWNQKSKCALASAKVKGEVCIGVGKVGSRHWNASE